MEYFLHEIDPPSHDSQIKVTRPSLKNDHTVSQQINILIIKWVYILNHPYLSPNRLPLGTQI